MFSRRIPSDLAANRLAMALAARRAAGRQFIDLTESNPTRAGFDYPADLLAPLADARALTYAPSPVGLRDAREAGARDYARPRLGARGGPPCGRGRCGPRDARGAVARDSARQRLDVPADRIVLAASTS